MEQSGITQNVERVREFLSRIVSVTDGGNLGGRMATIQKGKDEGIELMNRPATDDKTGAVCNEGQALSTGGVGWERVNEYVGEQLRVGR